MAKKGIVYTPFADACLHGVTRGFIIELYKKHNVEIHEKNISLTELYNADEVFTTGTMGELTPVTSIDDWLIENRNNSDVMKTLIQHFEGAIESFCVKV